MNDQDVAQQQKDQRIAEALRGLDRADKMLGVSLWLLVATLIAVPLIGIATFFILLWWLF